MKYGHSILGHLTFECLYLDDSVVDGVVKGDSRRLRIEYISVH